VNEHESRDAIANRRVHLRRVLQTRLGLPDRVEVLDAAGRLIASITATEGAIVVAAVHGGRLASDAPAGELVAMLAVSFDGSRPKPRGAGLEPVRGD
jgi:hypothetical protein